MVHYHLITLGKLKEAYWRDAAAEYLKRLKPFATVTIHELREESFTEKDKPEIVREREAKKIAPEIEKIKNSYLIVLDEHGKQFSSIQFANLLNPSLYPSPIRGGAGGGVNNLTIQQCSNVTFVIGGPLGLHESVCEHANLILSLSPFTFTHQMARVILLEQIYRAMMIAHGRNYHY